MTSAIRMWWRAERAPVLWVAIVIMAVAAAVWLSYEFSRLLWQDAPAWSTSPSGAVDLKQRYGEIQRWFAGMPVYGALWTATYPPASYLLLWPFLGWPSLTTARLLWGATSVAALLWLTYLIVRETGARGLLERTFVALIPLAIYGTGATIGNGQLTVHVLPILVTALLCARRADDGWDTAAAVGALFLLALVKPSITIPFAWMFLLLPRSFRPAALVAVAYAALTLVAVSFQSASPLEVGRAWLAHVMKLSALISLSWERVSLHSLAALLGPSWTAPVSLLVWASLGWWTYRNRDADSWLLLGTSAVTARFWTYHGWYDDILVLLPLVALFRIVKRGEREGGRDVMAGLLFAGMLLFMLAPGGLYLLPQPWKAAYVLIQLGLWFAVLLFLLGQVRRDGGVVAAPDVLSDLARHGHVPIHSGSRP